MSVPYSWEFNLFNGQDPFSWGIWAGFMVAILIFVGIMVLISIGMYVLQALGLYTIARRRGHENPWMAWVPFVNVYLMGVLADALVVQNGRKDWYMRWWLLGGVCGSFVLSLFSAIPFIGLLFALLSIPISLACAVIQYFAFYELLREYEPKNQVLYLVLSIVISPLMSLFFFVIRNKPAVHGDAQPQAQENK